MREGGAGMAPVLTFDLSVTAGAECAGTLMPSVPSKVTQPMHICTNWIKKHVHILREKGVKIRDLYPFLEIKYYCSTSCSSSK